ncbi:hypothetical protein DBR42_02070, partial [Pelomonas sp. HMWF004]
IEHPGLAGGHLGAARIADLGDRRFDFDQVLPACKAFFRQAGLERDIPLIAAGGVRSFEDIQRLQNLGADAVQLGTPFAVTSECDAHAEFKRVLAEASDADMVAFTSVAGLPARAVATPWLKAYLKAEGRLQAVAQVKQRCTKAFDCLAQCGLQTGLKGLKEWGQFCIDNQLAAALRDDVKKGLFFRGSGTLPFPELRQRDPQRAGAAGPAADACHTAASLSTGRAAAGKLNSGASTQQRSLPWTPAPPKPACASSACATP